MFQATFVNVDEFGSWDMEIIKIDASMQFTSKYFLEGLSLCGLSLSLAAPDHQETNGRVEVKWSTWRTISSSIMLHAQVSDEYIDIVLMKTTDYIYFVLPI